MNNIDIDSLIDALKENKKRGVKVLIMVTDEKEGIVKTESDRLIGVTFEKGVVFGYCKKNFEINVLEQLISFTKF
jgi:flavoprotein